MARSASAPAFSERLQRDWYLSRPTVLTHVLWPLSWLFAAVAGARRALYRQGLLAGQQLAVPVIVVGNVTVGGTGKTPLVLWLAQQLRERGLRPGIVARGHGGSNSEPRAVSAADDPRIAGDEPVLLARADVPVWIGHDRAAVARQLLAAEPKVNVIVSDDGLQHYRLARAFEIVVIDGARGFGNGRMLPSGPLREPVARIGRVDAIVVNGAGSPRLPLAISPPVFTMKLEGDRFISVTDPSRIAGAEAFAGKRIAAVAGIGNPSRFFDALRALGLDPVCHAFPDHHAYTAEDLRLPDAQVILMTDKDAIKCGQFADPRMWRLPVAATVGPGLVAMILEKLHGRQAA